MNRRRFLIAGAAISAILLASGDQDNAQQGRSTSGQITTMLPEPDVDYAKAHKQNGSAAPEVNRGQVAAGAEAGNDDKENDGSQWQQDQGGAFRGHALIVALDE